jgi:hypothetical protein
MGGFILSVLIRCNINRQKSSGTLAYVFFLSDRKKHQIRKEVSIVDPASTLIYTPLSSAIGSFAPTGLRLTGPAPRRECWKFRFVFIRNGRMNFGYVENYPARFGIALCPESL